MAYNASRGRVAIFGGEHQYFDLGYGFELLADTWEWNGTAWAEWTSSTTTIAPPARNQHAMAYDGARGRVVLLGGYGQSSGVLADTWEWDGSAWVQRAPAASPPARKDHALAYDGARGRVVLFGGRATPGCSPNVGWDGANWVQRFPRRVRRPARNTPWPTTVSGAR